MKKMTGIIIMIAGVVIIAFGFILYRNSTTSKVAAKANVSDEVIIDKSSEENKEPLTEDEAKKTGDDFERFVVENFPSKYYSILEWTSDKEANGKFVEANKNPDIVMQLNYYGKKYPFAVECKYRKYFYKGSIEYSYPDQLERYRKFAKERNLPVFIVVGVGGSATSPKEMFVLPLDELKSHNLTRSEISKYYKSTESPFFYKFETKTLE